MVNEKPFPRNEWILLISLMALAAVLRIPNLTESLWYDEVMYSTSQGAATWSDLWRFIVKNPPPPLYRTLMFFWTRVFGEQEISARLPSLLFGIFSVGLLYRIAQAFGSRAMAVLTALLLCFSPVHIWYSQEGTPYSMALFFLLAAIYLLIYLPEGPLSGKWLFAYLAFLLAAVFTHSLTVVFLLPLTVIAFRRSEPRFQQLRVIHLTVFLCFVSYLAAKYVTGHLVTGMYFLRPFRLFDWWMLFFNWFLSGNSLWPVAPDANVEALLHRPPLLILQVLFFAIFLAGLFAGRNRDEGKKTLEGLLLVCTLPLVMLFMTLMGAQYIYIERYLFPVLPLFLMMIARGATVSSNRRIAVPATLFTLLIAICSFTAFLYRSDTFTVYKQNPDWRSASLYLFSERPQLADEVAVFAVPADDFIYYLKRKGPDHTPDFRYYGRKALMEGVPFIEKRTFHIIKNLYWAGASDQVLAECFSQGRYQLLSRKSFKGVEIYTFVQKY